MAELGNRILVVENSAVQARIISEHIEDMARFGTISASTMDQVRDVLAERRGELFLAVCNLSIKGAANGEAVDLLLEQGVPVVVLTSTFDDDLRNRYLEKRVLDYFVKGVPGEMDGLVDLVRRIWHNRETKVLVVDDTVMMRRLMQDLLEKQHFQVLAAENGREALDIVIKHPELDMVVTDFEMPVMDGIDFVRKVREYRTREELSVIGVSSHGSGALTARFLKNGANDFLKKPFEAEEFLWRVNKNIGEQERIRQARESFSKDVLTGFLRLRYFATAAREACGGDSGASCLLATIALEGLARLHATEGFQAGDDAVENAAGVVRSRFPDALAVGRLGSMFHVLLDADGADVKARLGEVLASLGVEAAAAYAGCTSEPDRVVRRLVEYLAAPGREAGGVARL